MTDRNKDLAIEVVDIDSLRQDPRNARLHPRKNIEAIKASLSRFGQQKPIVVGADGFVVAGNGTMQGAKELGWKTIAIVRSELSGEEAAAFAISDNRTAEIAEWDWSELSKTMEELAEAGVDMTQLGWTSSELAAMAGTELSSEEKEVQRPRTEATAETFLNTQIRQLILYMNTPEFEWAISALSKIAQRDGLPDNTAVVLSLIRKEVEEDA